MCAKDAMLFLASPLNSRGDLQFPVLLKCKPSLYQLPREVPRVTAVLVPKPAPHHGGQCL